MFSLIKLKYCDFRTVVHNKYIDGSPPFKKTEEYFISLVKGDAEPNFLAIYLKEINPKLSEAVYKGFVLYSGDRDACIRQLEQKRNPGIPERFLVSFIWLEKS
jgi:hypothetical protein